MVEGLEQERATIEALPEGPELINFLVERFGWEFRESLNPNLPIPSHACEATLQANEDSMHELLQQYGQRHIVIDGFNKDHDARRIFFKGVLGPKVSWLKEQSKLRNNNYYHCTLIIKGLLRRLMDAGVTVNFDIQKMEEALTSKLPYSQMELVEKIEYAKTFDQQIYEFFLALSRATSQHSLQ